MNKAFIILLLSAGLHAHAQTPFPESPANAKFVTTDVTNFWKAFDAFKKGYKGNPFADLYINIGSPGLQDFMPDRILHADSLLNIIKKRTPSYAGMRKIRSTCSTKKNRPAPLLMPWNGGIRKQFFHLSIL